MNGFMKQPVSNDYRSKYTGSGVAFYEVPLKIWKRLDGVMKQQACIKYCLKSVYIDL